MAFKVNYGLERAERNRAKQAKRDAKAKGKKSGAEPAAELSEAPAEPSLPSIAPEAGDGAVETDG